jgi:hypothetical protein
LTSVDFPTLGRPTIVMNPERLLSWSGSLGGRDTRPPPSGTLATPAQSWRQARDGRPLSY